MKHAETVTFGGAGIQRAAEQRGDSAQDILLAKDSAKFLPFWRSKPLVTGQDEGDLSLGWLPKDHEVVKIDENLPIFLGFDDDVDPCFAVNVSAWTPEELPDSLNTFLDPSEQRHPALSQNHCFAELRAIMTRLTPQGAEFAAIARGLLEWHRTHGFCSNCGALSDMVQAGWQRNCPSCGRHHFPRTDPVVIMLITNGNSVLIGRSPGWPEKMYSLLAGFVEPGETMEAAVRREVFEETGVKVGPVSYLASQPWPFPALLMLGCWGQAESTGIHIDPNEIEDAMWVTREEMMEVFQGTHCAINPARKGAIAHFLLENWLSDSLN